MMNIRPGDVLGIIAPSSPCDPEILRSGIHWLEKSGFRTRVVLDPSAAWSSPKHLFSSDTPEARVNALYDLYDDNEVRAVISVRGGYGAMELLPLIDFARLSYSAKPFVGISDGTVILNALSFRTTVPAIHGAAFAAGFSKAVSDQVAAKSCQDLLALLGGRTEFVWDEPIRYVVGSGDFEGAVVGGNLTMLAAVAGTPWAPVYDDQVLFIEEIGEKPYRLHRLLMQLKLAGSLERLKGVVVGELLNCIPPEGSSVSADEILRDIFSTAHYPVVTGAPFGHGPLNRAFQIGSMVRISSGKIQFLG